MLWKQQGVLKITLRTSRNGIMNKISEAGAVKSKELLSCVKNELRAELDRLQRAPLDNLSKNVTDALKY